MVTADKPVMVWRETPLLWGLLAVAFAILVFVFYDGIEVMVEWWNTREEYSHGMMIPLITLFLLWQKNHLLEQIEFDGSWWGVAITFVGVSAFLIAELGGVWTVIMYSFLLTLYGVLLSLSGARAFKVVLIPLLILVFMLPLPNFIYNDLSNQLQLISSQLGVAVIRLFGISVYLEGNIIDLGVYQLQVVEACSGLRYLFPLMSLGCIAAYFFTGAMWKKVVIFISTIPITVLMNSFRIGVIGVTVEYWGIEMAEGFLHDFEGWVVFMSCIGILILEMWWLARIGKVQLPLQEAFGIDFPEPTPEGATLKPREIPVQFKAAIVVLTLALASTFLIEKRQETIPDRKSYVGFPLKVGEWKGNERSIEQIYIDTLKLDDYAMINYSRSAYRDDLVNFYSAYYESQRKDSTTHSPRACIPGGGWHIAKHTVEEVEGVQIGGVPLKVNRLLIVKDDIKQLVYYWFQQRGRVITDEYILKWYFFVDSVQMNRTDGALMRVTTILEPGQDISIADERLSAFVTDIAPLVPDYVPD